MMLPHRKCRGATRRSDRLASGSAPNATRCELRDRCLAALLAATGLLATAATPQVAFLLTAAAFPTAVAAQEADERHAASPDTPRPPAIDRHPPLWVPPGFVVERVAGPPLVEHPMMAAFDDRGRLYVAENAGVNLDAEALLAELPNSIRLLEDTNGDGRFDRSTVFADRMTFPMGAAWHEGALYVASPPHIWRLVDTNDDGVADVRQELVSKFGFIGNAADIHGCFIGPTGRIYWCDGRHGHEFTDAEGRTLSKGKAARIFSCRPDGSDVEVFAGGGMDNPVEVAFTETGEMLGTMTFYNPDEQRHDALVHWIWGGVYPRRHPVLAEFRRTGEWMPALSLFDVVAPAGLCCYRGEALGAEFRGNAFSAHFNTHRIVRHVLERDGATFRSRDEDWLVSTDPDFHPTDVLEDADGSLLVIDTGGWFRIGCPTSQVAKPEILGAIYRIRRADHPTAVDPRGAALAWDAAATIDALVARLDDPRPAVRERAIGATARRGEAAVAPLAALLRGAASRQAALGAVWTLSRIASPAAAAALIEAVDHSLFDVQLAAVTALGVRREPTALERLASLAETADLEPAVRREAATALGRIGDRAAVPALLAALWAGGDRFLEHAQIYALIELADPAATRQGLAHPSPLVRRGALIALDQMPGSDLIASEVVALLDTDDMALRTAALEVIAARETWAGEIRAHLEAWLADGAAASEPRQQRLLRGALLAHVADRQVQELIGQTLGASDPPAVLRMLLLEVIARSDVHPLPEVWRPGLLRSLAADQPELRRQALSAVAAVESALFDDAVRAMAESANEIRELRVAAWHLLAGRATAISDEGFALLVAELSPDGPPLARRTAAEALGRTLLSVEQQHALLACIEAAGPLELPALLPAFAQASDPVLGHALLAALERSPGRSRTAWATALEVLATYPADVREAAARHMADESSADDASLAERLAALEPAVAAADTTRGRAVFDSQKAACTACHRVGESGGLVGPDLSRIGQIRTPRDLLESIIAPSRSLARGYESFTLTTTRGQAFTGVIRRETADAIYLHTAERSELRVPRHEIDELAPSPSSVMPEGLDRVLSADELADLVAYLSSLK